MFVVRKTAAGMTSLPVKELSAMQLKHMASALACRILRELAASPSYPRELARRLKVHEQKVYYHVRNLEKARIIEVSKTEVIQGRQASFYKVVEPAFFVRFADFESTQRVSGIEAQPNNFLEPFVEDGKLNAVIIVGSPDPHGPEKARSRDGYYGIDFALFLGTFLNYLPDLKVKLDTEANAEDLKSNLILIGGPIVNTVTGRINNKLPVHFEQEKNWAVYSSLSKKRYFSDETGIVVKAKNPFNQKKCVLLIAGKRYAGTRAVMIAFLRHFRELCGGNRFSPKTEAKVVEGVDLNSDGVVDEAEVLE